METNDDVRSIKQSLMNEKFSPEILKFNTEAFEDLKTCLDYQTKLVEEDITKNRPTLETNLLEMEIERMRYYLAEYLRTRMRKIQKYYLYISKSKTMIQRLTEQERQFLEGYSKIMSKCLETSAMFDVPKRYKEITALTPNLNKFVIVKALENIGTLQIAEGRTVEIAKGDTYALKYQVVAGFIATNKMRLV